MQLSDVMINPQFRLAVVEPIAEWSWSESDD
jgi:hypothetical protein